MYLLVVIKQVRILQDCGIRHTFCCSFLLDFITQSIFTPKSPALLVCILMPVKYAPAHTNRVGASTEGYTVDVLHVSRHPFGAGEERRLAQYPHSSPLRGSGGDTKAQTGSNAAFDFSFPPRAGLSVGFRTGICSLMSYWVVNTGRGCLKWDFQGLDS